MLTKIGDEFVEAVAIVSGGASDEMGVPWHSFLTVAGNGTGAYNHNGDYSTTAAEVFYQAPAKYVIHTVFATIADASAMNQVDYGAIAGGLTNGVTLWIMKQGVEIPLLGGLVIKNNQQWLNVTPDALLTNFPGVPQSFIPVFRLTEGYGSPLVLNPGERFIVKLHDDFTGLVDHTFTLRGTLY